MYFGLLQKSKCALADRNYTTIIFATILLAVNALIGLNSKGPDFHCSLIFFESKGLISSFFLAFQQNP